MARHRARIETDAAWAAYRRDLAKAGQQLVEDATEPDMLAPAPVVPGSCWYRSTLWPDAGQVSSGRGGWWDDGETSAADESTPSGSRTLATRS